MVYIVMNNGCYGLTKGQDSATADFGSKSKAGSVNPFESIDLAGLAMELGATFVAQSFSGDKHQLIPLVKAAINHNGFAFINVISPCVTFNNNPGSTKSYDYVRQHMETTGMMDFVPIAETIETSYGEGTHKEVKMHDGSFITLNKLAQNWDPTNKVSAMNALHASRAKGEVLTGLLYFNAEGKDLHHVLNSSARPMNSLTEKELCPGNDKLKGINEELM